MIHMTVTIPKTTLGNSERKQCVHIVNPSPWIGEITKPRIAAICSSVSIEVILFASRWNNVFTSKALKRLERSVQMDRTERTISERRFGLRKNVEASEAMWTIYFEVLAVDSEDAPKIIALGDSN